MNFNKNSIVILASLIIFFPEIVAIQNEVAQVPEKESHIGKWLTCGGASIGGLAIIGTLVVLWKRLSCLNDRVIKLEHTHCNTIYSFRLGMQNAYSNWIQNPNEQTYLEYIRCKTWLEHNDSKWLKEFVNSQNQTVVSP